MAHWCWPKRRTAKTRFTEGQIAGFLREADAEVAVKDLCRRHGFSEGSYYLWRSSFGGMGVSGFVAHTLEALLMCARCSRRLSRLPYTMWHPEPGRRARNSYRDVGR